jgi:hypothetical protein
MIGEPVLVSELQWPPVDDEAVELFEMRYRELCARRDLEALLEGLPEDALAA